MRTRLRAPVRERASHLVRRISTSQGLAADSSMCRELSSGERRLQRAMAERGRVAPGIKQPSRGLDQCDVRRPSQGNCVTRFLSRAPLYGPES